MMKTLAIYCFLMSILLCRPNTLAAQDRDTTGGKTEIIQDSRVDLLVKKHIQINQVLNTMDGFRIQVFSDSGTNSKNKAQATHDEFQARYPGLGVYLTFKSPNYKVRIGDFRTKLDAQRFLIELTADYPNAFIIADQINLPKTD
ncbi:MAG: SPOR domain-containing protein [Bacteroidetes bacterium]|nr:SPOR domain-containing protein [Bacteroidota bacterium]